MTTCLYLSAEKSRRKSSKLLVMATYREKFFVHFHTLFAVFITNIYNINILNKNSSRVPVSMT